MEVRTTDAHLLRAPYVTRLVPLSGRYCGSARGHLREVSVKARLCLLVADATMAPCVVPATSMSAAWPSVGPWTSS
jgi:hypothetical protein